MEPLLQRKAQNRLSSQISEDNKKESLPWSTLFPH